MKTVEKNKFYTYFIILLFIIYILILAYLLFFASEFSRDHISMMDGNYLETLKTQWENTTNLSPFKTIQTMLQIYDNPYYSNMIAHINLYGNILIFMPFSFFIPYLFSAMRKPRRFLRFMLFLIVLVEVLQLFTFSGSMDIDDVILNYFGVLISFYICKKVFAQKH